MDRIIIVGGGQAAGQAAASLRQEGFEGAVTLVCDEPHPPYQRPPLSKQYLAGEQGPERLPLRPESFYAEGSIELRLGERVASLDPGAHRVTLAGGETLEYSRLVLATGSRVRRLDALPGAGLAGIHYLRTVEDADGIRAGLGAGREVVIVGGGYIGLEVASVSIAAGAKVTVLEAMDRILQRVAPPELSAYYTRVHRAHGVDVRSAAALAAFEGRGAVDAVRLADGTRLGADTVIVGVGIQPNVSLAEAAGIACDNGIAVDTSCRTSAPDVLAAGDCVSHENAYAGRRIRLESVPNAMEQGRVVAAVLAGKDRAYDAEPWFWSDQYDLKLQMAGFSTDADRHLTRGDVDANQFITFHLKDGVVVGVDAVNSMREFLPCRKLVAERRRPDPEALTDPSVPVKDLLG